MVDRTKLDALLSWMFHAIGDDVLSLIIVDRQGLILASKSIENIDEELIGGLSALVEPVLKRVSKEMGGGSFGTGAFDTERNRMIFTEAGPQAVLVAVMKLTTTIDRIFPYTYLCAEKIARIMDGRPVSPVIPKFETESVSPLQITNQNASEPGVFKFKCILGGDGAVGKTTLVQTFSEGIFNEDYKATIGAQIMKKEIHFKDLNVEVRYVIWDLAGQTQFKKVRESYVKGAETGFIVFDVTRRPTFESVTTWYQEIKENAVENIKLMLIGNKIDLEGQRQVSKEEAMTLADKLGIPYMETSALDKDLVDEAFRSLALYLITSRGISIKKF
jgi:small GTP-binding protein